MSSLYDFLQQAQYNSSLGNEDEVDEVDEFEQEIISKPKPKSKSKKTPKPKKTPNQKKESSTRRTKDGSFLSLVTKQKKPLSDQEWMDSLEDYVIPDDSDLLIPKMNSEDPEKEFLLPPVAIRQILLDTPYEKLKKIIIFGIKNGFFQDPYIFRGIEQSSNMDLSDEFFTQTLGQLDIDNLYKLSQIPDNLRKKSLVQGYTITPNDLKSYEEFKKECTNCIYSVPFDYVGNDNRTKNSVVWKFNPSKLGEIFIESPLYFDEGKSSTRMGTVIPLCGKETREYFEEGSQFLKGKLQSKSKEDIENGNFGDVVRLSCPITKDDGEVFIKHLNSGLTAKQPTAFSANSISRLKSQGFSDTQIEKIINSPAATDIKTQ